MLSCLLMCASLLSASAWTEASCAADSRCYPSHVSVRGLNSVIKTETHNFEIHTLFDDVLYVWLEGPELIAGDISKRAHATNHSHIYDVKLSFRIRGRYKLRLRVDQIGTKRIGFHRELFASPYHILVVVEKVRVDMSNRPLCQTVSAASKGSWYHHERVDGASFGDVIRVTRDDYVWVPTTCNLNTNLWNTTFLRQVYSREFCALGDSYLRTAISLSLLYVGLLNFSRYTEINTILRNHHWKQARMRFFWHQASNQYSECFDDPASVLLFSSLLEPSTRLKRELHHHCMNDSSRRRNCVWMQPHPWSGDILTHKRSNDRLLDVVRKVDDALEVDQFHAWEFANARHDEACDGSHFACADRGHDGLYLSPLAVWEGVILAHSLL